MTASAPRLGLRGAVLAFLALAVLAAVIHGARPRPPLVHEGDSPAYLAGAFHLARHGTFSQEMSDGAVAPSMGREPGYAAFLSLLMRLDPEGLGRAAPSCVTVPDGCPADYRLAQRANVALFVAAAACVFAAVLLIPGGGAVPALLAGGYILLNVEAAKWLRWLLSDALALFLVAACGLLAVLAVRHRRLWPWLAVGAALGLLGLTKGVFVLYAVLAVLVGLAAAAVRRDRRALVAAALLGLGFAAVLGPWLARNTAVTGRPTLADERSGIALSTREALVHMTPTEYAASLLFWTRGFGDDLARDLFGEAAVARLRLETPGGFYDVGQHGYLPRVAAAAAGGLPVAEAAAAVDREILHAILTAPVAYAATMVPVFYRGIWIDEFIWLGLPALVWLSLQAVRQRNWAAMLLVSAGWFNLLVYAAVSLNIPRYQMTALPALAVAAGLALPAMAARWSARRRTAGSSEVKSESI